MGEVSDDFEITNRETGEPLKLSDYDGHVVVLDFFGVVVWPVPDFS